MTPKLNYNTRTKTGAPVDCSQANVCSQRCLTAGTLDPITRRPLELDRCDCFAGFQLAADGATCSDIDECRLNLHTCARHSEVCDNTRGSFRCLARAGSQPAVRSLSISSSSEPTLEEPTTLEERPFASLRLCAAGGARCPPQQQQQQWKRNVATYSTSSSSSATSSSSRRVARNEH